MGNYQEKSKLDHHFKFYLTKEYNITSDKIEIEYWNLIAQVMNK